jgi:hypothetical protein
VPIIRETPVETYRDGVLVESTVVVQEISDEQDREERIRARLVASLQANRDYVAAPAAMTTANRLSALESQVKLLSRQNNALVRLVNQLMDGDD